MQSLIRTFAFLVSTLALAALGFAPAQAIPVNVDICVDFQTNYTDLGGDWWTTNDDRPARGIWLSILEWSTGDEMFPTHYTDWVQGNGGCASVILDTTEFYLISTESRAEVNGVEINSYDDVPSPDPATYIHYLAYSPTVGASLNLALPATTQYGQLAVATWAFYRNNAGLAGSEALIEFFDDGCCSASSVIQASTTSKYIIGHELGHGVGFRRDFEQNPSFDYNAAENGCDGDSVPRSGHGQSSKEFQSGAAVEGWADFFAAWAWNRNSENDCLYDRHYSSDFDLDGTVATSNGQISCEGIPTSGISGFFITDPFLNGVTARDWLEDAINGGLGTCSGTLANRGSQYDWLRFWWDMVTDENVAFGTLVNVYDNMDPRSFDADGSTITIVDDPFFRVIDACNGQGLTAECAAQDNNGVDH